MLSSLENQIPTHPNGLPHREPFSHLNVPSPADRQQNALLLAGLGVRRFPPPFGHAVSVLSDIDASDRERSRHYHGELIRELGLDFGDSCWLFGRLVALPSTPATRQLREMPGLGVVHPSTDAGAWRGEQLGRVRSFAEMVAGMLRGDFDHFHAFMPSGHRVVWVDRTEVVGCEAVFKIRAMQSEQYFQTSEMRIAGIGAVGSRFAAEGVESASTVQPAMPCEPFMLDRESDSCREEIRLGEETEAAALLLPKRRPGPGNPLPHLWLVDEIRVRCGSPEAAEGLRAIAVFNATPGLILGTLANLDERWNLRSSLITEHSGYCFLNEKSRAFHAKNVYEESLKDAAELRGWVNGNAEGPMRFSGLPDEPGSFCRLFPELVSSRGFRFVNAGGLTGSPDYSFDAHDVVAPSLVRDGSGVYICRRMMPTLPDGVDPDDPVLKATRAPSFGHRLRRLWQLMAEKPGRIWPIYTHLGGIQPLDEIPDPYLEREPLVELQDRVYGITGRFKPADRAWFVRGTGMCEHALLMRGLAGRVERPDANTARITPWRDETLGCDLPVSINQTYGLTFRVRDLANASVLVGDREVHELARFDHPDGRWVTLMPSVIREAVVGHVDPLTRPDAAVRRDRISIDDAAEAVEAERTGVSLGLRGPLRGIGRVSFDGRWLDPAGAQGFTYRVSAEKRKAGLAWVVETADGGRFAWGDPKIVRSLEGLTAWRAEPVPVNATITVPFWDMTWANGSLPGGPLPTRDIRRIELIVRGRVVVSDAAFIRPSAAQRDEPHEGTVVVGRVPMERADAWTVRLVPIDGGGAQECRPDPRGWFAFPGVRGGACRVWATDDSGARFGPRGGELVETRWNQTSVVFDEPV